MDDRPRTPGRPRAFDTDDVLDAALDVFWRLGYAATTTRVLEAELGLTQSSLYNAFGSKRELLERALDRYEARLDAAVVTPLVGADSQDAAAALARFVDDLRAWVDRDGRGGCLLLNVLAETSPDPVVVQRARAHRDRLRTVLRDAEVRRGTPAQEAASRAEALLAALLGMNIAARGGASSDELEAMAAGIRCQLVSA